MNVLGLFHDFEFVEDPKYDVSNSFDQERRYELKYLQQMVQKMLGILVLFQKNSGTTIG